MLRHLATPHVLQGSLASAPEGACWKCTVKEPTPDLENQNLGWTGSPGHEKGPIREAPFCFQT